MNSSVRITLYALLGFAIPILLGSLAPDLLRLTDDSDFDSVESAQSSAIWESAKTIAEDPPEEPIGYRSIESAENLDPSEGELFLISVQVDLSSYPPVGKRHRIITKYSWAAPPYPGWALAIRKTKTSLRPEVYWKGEDGSGGWYSFKSLPIDEAPGLFSLTLISSPGDFLNLYVGKDSGGALEFFGGYPLEKIQTPRTDSPVYFGSKPGSQSSVEGTVTDVVIASLGDEAPEGLIASVSEGGADPFALLAEDDISFSLAKSVED